MGVQATDRLPSPVLLHSRSRRGPRCRWPETPGQSRVLGPRRGLAVSAQGPRACRGSVGRGPARRPAGVSRVSLAPEPGRQEPRARARGLCGAWEGYGRSSPGASGPWGRSFRICSLRFYLFIYLCPALLKQDSRQLRKIHKVQQRNTNAEAASLPGAGAGATLHPPQPRLLKMQSGCLGPLAGTSFSAADPPRTRTHTDTCTRRAHAHPTEGGVLPGGVSLAKQRSPEVWGPTDLASGLSPTPGWGSSGAGRLGGHSSGEGGHPLTHTPRGPAPSGRVNSLHCMVSFKGPGRS